MLFPLEPDYDPFYAAPANLSQYLPGAVLGVREVVALVPVLRFGALARTLQVAYATTDG